MRWSLLMRYWLIEIVALWQMGVFGVNYFGRFASIMLIMPSYPPTAL
ncbi:hypothetical protein AEST_25150 [Alishewanella aestuarii B11]|uniref:Uncharacterized protein n=1 Tax=Alishewanella aestuarii B11 TaxID=1197174 RepID=J2IBU1_9ALTE|nr:hypothetical protein AEST_25150 [Alishewanella aestuarii B11]